jgi:SPP1 family predicted phage head-tail adaptor
MGLAAGRLRERVEIEAEVQTSNGQGGYVSAWSVVATVRAEVNGLSGGEAMRAGIERNVQQWRVTIRRRDDVTAKHRLQWLRPGNTRVRLDIKATMPDPKLPRDATLLLCESGD